MCRSRRGYAGVVCRGVVSAAASSLACGPASPSPSSTLRTHRLGWDLQHDHVLHPAVRMGLDGVYSDHVDLMMAVHEADPPG